MVKVVDDQHSGTSSISLRERHKGVDIFTLISIVNVLSQQDS